MSVGVSNDWLTVDQWRLGNMGLLAGSFRLEMPSQARPALALQLYHESAVNQSQSYAEVQRLTGSVF